MKVMMMKATVLVAMVVGGTAMAGDDVLSMGSAGSTRLTSEGAVAAGVDAVAVSEIKNAGNLTVNGSFNPKLVETANDINSNNLSDIAGDGIVVYGDRVDQALTASDLVATVSGNEVVLGSALSDTAALSPVLNNSTKNTYADKNSIANSYADASGIAILSQNTGHASAIQQSITVQSNLTLQ